MAQTGTWTLDSMSERLSMPLVKEAEVVDILIDELAGLPNAEGVFDEFHQAAVRDERLVQVAAAYRRTLRRTRLQHLSAEAQACVFSAAARFFTDMVSDPQLASRYAEQAIELHPRNALAREVLEVQCVNAEDVPRLAKLYHKAIDAQTTPDEQLRLARRAVGLLRAMPSSAPAAAGFLQVIVRLQPADADSFTELEDYCTTSANYRELAALLEQRLELASDPEDAIRWRLIAVYRDELQKPEEVARHLEILLEREPAPPIAVHAAEGMLEVAATAHLIAPAVAALYHRAGRSSDELSVLSRAVKDASGESLDRMLWRLAQLRVELLDDPAGALDAVQPLLMRAPGRDDVRSLFIELSRRTDQLADASRLLERVARTIRDADVRAKVEWEVAQLALERRDAKAEREAYRRIVQSGSHAQQALMAAQALLGVSENLDRKSLEAALAIVAERAESASQRMDAAEQLLELTPAAGKKSRRVAWLALMDSAREQEALPELLELLEPESDAEVLATVLARVAAITHDEEAAFGYAFRAAELRASLASSPLAAIEAWRQLILMHGATRAVYAKMLPLLESSGDYAAVADTLHADSELASEEERSDVLCHLGDVLREHLEDASTAVEAYRRALVLDRGHQASRSRLEAWLGAAEPELRLLTADALESVLTPEDPVWLRIHELRAESLPDPAMRLDAFRRAAELLRRGGGKPSEGRELCGRALGFAVVEAPEQVADWIELVEWFASAADEPHEATVALVSALEQAGDAFVGEPLVALATAAGAALAREDRFEEALRAWERALTERPTADLMRRVDGLLTRSGLGLDERAARYREAISRAQKRDCPALVLDFAQLLENANDIVGAAAVGRELLDSEPQNVEVLRRVVVLLKRLGERATVLEILHRSLSLVEGGDKAYVLAELAAWEPERAESFYLEALRSGPLADGILTTIKAYAGEAGNFELELRLLEHRAQYAGDPLKSGQAYEELGHFLGEQLDADAGAASAFKRAAMAYQQIPEQRAHAVELFEHALTLVPEDLEAAEPLVFLFIELGQWSRVAGSLTILLRTEEAHARILDRIIALFDDVIRAGAVTEYVALLDEILWLPELSDSPKLRDVMAVKARVLAAGVPAQQDAAADAFRAVIEAHADPRDVAQFASLIASMTDSQQRLEESRWLYEWRLNRSNDPVGILGEWAAAEEAAQDSASALGIYERLVEHESGRLPALEAIQRLRLASGDWEGAFDAMSQLLDLVDGERRLDLARQMATVAIRRLFDPARALPSLQLLLPEPEAVELAVEALGDPSVAERVASMFDVVIESLRCRPAELARLLGRLREALPSDEALRPFTKVWFSESLLVLPGDSPEFYEVSVAAATQFPLDSSFWDHVEAGARATNDPAPAASAYQQALQNPDVAVGDFGRRAQAFIQEWYGGNSEQSQAVMEAVCDADPSVSWAFDRLKLALTSRGEWSKLFALYDRALSRAETVDERAALLDEASVAAKDLASEPERALAYLEPLRELRPDDQRVEVSLERLYDRLALRQPLAAMLEKRLPRLEGRERRETEQRLAELWMALEEPGQALSYASPLLGDDSHHLAAATVVEQIAFSTSEQPEADALSEVKRRSLEMLEAYYRRHGRFGDVARVMQQSAERISDVRLRTRRLRELVQLDLEQLDDPHAAFNVMCSLVVLDPASEVHRVELAELAKRTYSFARWTATLEQAAAAAQTPALALDLLTEAANVYLESLDDKPRATQLLTDVMNSDADRKKSLSAARRVVELEQGVSNWAAYCEALERVAVLSSGKMASVKAWNAAAAAIFELLGDAERAAMDYRRALEFDDASLEAYCGLVDALAKAGRNDELVDALLRRSKLADPENARQDRARAAQVLTNDGRLDDAIGVWAALGIELGHDRDSLEALSSLLERTSRLEELATLWRSYAESHGDTEEGQQLWSRLGVLLAEKLNRPDDAIQAYIQAGGWNRACSVAIGTPTGGVDDMVPSFLRQVLRVWRELGAEPSHELAPVVLRAVRAQAQRALEGGRPESAAKSLLNGADLPVATIYRRELRAEAATAFDATAGGRDRAIELLAGLVEEDPLDSVANAAIPRLLAWLEEAGSHGEIARIWEIIAKAAPEKSERARRAWNSAGTLFSEKLGDLERARVAFKAGWEQGSLDCLRALTQILETTAQTEQAAEALEALLVRVEGDERESTVLRLADAHSALGDLAVAARHIEGVRESGTDSSALRTRLAQLYQTTEQFAKLAALLAQDADSLGEPRAQAVRLAEAAEVYLKRLSDPRSAVPLLARAAELDPADAQLPLQLAVALSSAGEFERAVEAFNTKLAAYGDRRPQERAIVNRFLARALLAGGQREAAYQALKDAADIYPDHPGIQHELAQLAFELGELDHAERTCRTLLLMLRSRVSAPSEEIPSVAAVYLDLSEIAGKRGDPSAAEDFVHSAFEVSVGSTSEAVTLEKELERRGMVSWLRRALESRIRRSSGAEAADALVELARTLHDPSAEPEFAVRVREAAEDLYAAMVTVDAPEPRAIKALASAFEIIGAVEDLERIGKMYRHLVTLRPTDVRAWRSLLGWLEPRGRLGDAAALVVELDVAAQPKSRNVCLELVRSFSAGSTTFEAGLGLLRALLQQNRDDAEALELLVSSLEKAGRTAELVDMLKLQLDLVMSSPNASAGAAVAQRLADALSKDGRQTEAADVLRDVVARDPSNLAMLRELERCLGSLGAVDVEYADILEKLLAAATGPEAAELSLRAASLRRSLGDEVGAVAALERGFAACPSHSGVLEALLEIDNAAGQTEQARQRIRRSLDAYPMRASLWQALTSSELESRQYEAALKSVERGLGYHEGDVALLELRARCLAEVDSFVEALDAARDWVRVGRLGCSALVPYLDVAVERSEPPRRDEFEIELANVLFECGRGPDAVSRLVRWLREPTSQVRLPGYRLLLDQARLQGDSVLLADALEPVVELVSDVDERLNLSLEWATACAAIGREDSTRSALKLALSLAGSSIQTRETVVDRVEELYRRLGACGELAQLLVDEAAREVEPNARGTKLVRAARVFVDDVGDLDAAHAVLLDAIALRPADLESTTLLARLQVARGDRSSAKTTLAAALRASGRGIPDEVEAYRLLAHLQLCDDELHDAFDTLKIAHDIDKQHAPTAMQLGLLAHDLDDFETAEAALRFVVLTRSREDDGLTPSQRATACYHLAHIVQWTGKPVQARMYASKGLSERPEGEIKRKLEKLVYELKV